MKNNIIAGEDLNFCHLTYGLYSSQFRVFTSSPTATAFSARSLNPRMPTNRLLLHPCEFVFASTYSATNHISVKLDPSGCQLIRILQPRRNTWSLCRSVFASFRYVDSIRIHAADKKVSVRFQKGSTTVESIVKEAMRHMKYQYCWKGKVGFHWDHCRAASHSMLRNYFLIIC